MNRYVLPLVGLLLACGLAALTWFAIGGGPAPVETDADPRATADARAALEPAGADGAARSRELEGSDAPSAAGTGAALAGPDSGRASLDDAIRVDGVVRAPEGCADDAREVLAYSAERSLDDVFADLAAERAPGAAEPWLARAAVGPDGSFRLALPRGTERASLSLVGRYQHGAVAVDLAAGARTTAIDARCGAAIAGQLALPAGYDQPLAALDGTKVTLTRRFEGFRGVPDAAVRVAREARAADGRFLFAALPTDGRYDLRVEPDRLAVAAVAATDLVAGRDTALRVELARGATLRGFVRDESGAPVASAAVEAKTRGQWFGFDNRTVRAGKSGSDGAFELPAVTPGRVLLTAELDGYLESDETALDLQEGGVHGDLSVVLPSGAVVAGTVAWAGGGPAADVEVEVDFDPAAMMGMGAFNARRGADGETRTDAQGRFRVGGLGKGPFVVTAGALPPGMEGADPKVAKRSRHVARADGVQPGTLDLGLVLRELEGLAGRVVDVEGSPVREFTVHAQRVGQGMLASLGQPSVEERFDDAEGRFVLGGMEAGSWRVQVAAEDFAPSEPVELALPRAETDPELGFALVRAATVAGFVETPDGARFAGAKVELDNGQPSWQRALERGPREPDAQSGDGGAFLLEGLRPGKLALVARSKEWAASLPVELDVAAGARADGVVLVLRRGGALTGEVYGDDGKPGVGRLVQTTEPTRFEQQMGFSDGEGRFRFDHLSPGTWQVVALPADDGGGSAEDAAVSMMSKLKMAAVEITDGEVTHVVLGAPPADPVRVRGTVTHAGAPYSGALVMFMPEGKQMLGSMKSASVDADGRYSVELDAPGRHAVTIQKLQGGPGQQNVLEFRCDVPEAEEHVADFVLPTGRVSGRVRGPDGEPAAGARVSLRPEAAIRTGTFWGGAYTELVTDNEGRYDIEALRPGRYALVVGGTALGGLFGNEDAAHGREVRDGLDVDEGEWLRDVDFRLRKPGSVEIEVVDAGGRAVEGASVFARTKEGRVVDRMSMLSTDARGKRIYRGLAPGEYTFTARTGELVSQESGRVEVEAGERATARLVLEAGTVLIVVVQGKDDLPVEASVSVQDDQGHEVGGMVALSEVMKLFTGGQGASSDEQRVGPLPPGKYKARATAADGRSVSKAVTLNGQPERKVTLRFD